MKTFRLLASPDNIAGIDAATRVMLAQAQKEAAKTWFIKAAGGGLAAGMILAGGGGLLWGAARFFPPRPPEKQITLILPANPASANPRPTEAQFKTDPTSTSLVNVVVFRTKQFANGDVTTGGQFEKPTQGLPSTQWCMYRQGEADGAVRFVTIGREGKKLDLPNNPSPFPDVDLNKAYSLCDWWPLAPAPFRHASND
jgi:hypothetical protein